MTTSTRMTLTTRELEVLDLALRGYLEGIDGDTSGPDT